MINLVRMDLRRLFRSRAFIVCFSISALLALVSTPFDELLIMLGRMFIPNTSAIAAVDKTMPLSNFFFNPLVPNGIGAILPFLSLVSFFYADIENGYIKNIAGQLPSRGLTIFSKFFAAIPHNLLFLAAGVVFNLIGTLIFRPLAADDKLLASVGTFFIKLLLMQSVSTILVLVVSSIRLKSLGSIMAVLMGSSIMSLIYDLFSSLLGRIGINVSISKYMPDALLAEPEPAILTAVISSLVVGAFFLLLAIRVFDRRDVK